MKLLTIGSGPKASCFVPNPTINGLMSSGAYPIVSVSVPHRSPLQLHPLKLSVKVFSYGSASASASASYQRKATRFKHFVPSASGAALAKSSSSSPDKRRAIFVWSAITLVLAVFNRVLLKLALVPMKEYPFFLAQLNSLAYVMTFFSVLHVRYHAGVTTDEMLAMPKLPFIAIGFLEAVSTVFGMYAGAKLPGPAIPLLFQTFLVWQLLFSRLLLRRRYSVYQLIGCFLVAAGVVVAVTSGTSNNQMLSGVGVLWPALMIASSAFQAAASIVKESVFLDAATHLKGKSLDIFVVNSFASGFQAIFILFFLPILSISKGIPLSKLPLYFTSGAACFLNLGTNTIGCDGAPLLPLLYIGSNILLNISILSLVKVSNAIVASLAARSSVPIAIYVLSLPLPYLAKEMRLSPFFHLGTLILVVGLLLYNIPRSYTQTRNQNL